MNYVIVLIIFFQIPCLITAIQNQYPSVPLTAFKPNLFNLALRMDAERKQKMEWKQSFDPKTLEDDYIFVVDEKAPVTPIMEPTGSRYVYKKRPYGVIVPKTVTTTTPTTTVAVQPLSANTRPNMLSLAHVFNDKEYTEEYAESVTTVTPQPFVRFVPRKINLKPRTMNTKKKKKPIQRQPSAEIFYRRELEFNSPAEGINCYDVTSYLMKKKNKNISKIIDYVVFMLDELMSIHQEIGSKSEVISVLYEIIKLNIRFHHGHQALWLLISQIKKGYNFINYDKYICVFPQTRAVWGSIER